MEFACPQLIRQNEEEKRSLASKWWLCRSITSSPKVPIRVVKKIAPSSKNSPPPDSLPQPRPKSSSPKPPPSLTLPKTSLSHTHNGLPVPSLRRLRAALQDPGRPQRPQTQTRRRRPQYRPRGLRAARDAAVQVRDQGARAVGQSCAVLCD